MTSINYSLFSGMTGLAANSDGMNVISNNIANANTKGFKTDRAEFEDQLSTTLNENSQLGRGARLRNITTLQNQGALTNTGQITDLGVQGEGFFVVKNDSIDARETDGTMFTRQGSFHFDKEGKLVDMSGARVQGYMPENGNPHKMSPKLSDIQLITNVISPKPTEMVNVVANLDIREKYLNIPFNPEKASETSNFVTAVTIYDNFGVGRQAQVYFNRTSDVEKNMWEWHALIDGTEVSANPPKDSEGKPIPFEFAKGQIEFNAEGNPIPGFTNVRGEPSYIDVIGKSDGFDIKFLNGNKSQKIQFNFGNPIGEDGKIGTQGSTSIAARSGVSFHSQDGYEAGYLKTLKIDVDGYVRGVYTNGLERRLAAVALASFPNNQGLVKVGHNNYTASPKAGEARIGLPQTGSRGSIYSAALEESNVDLAQQFVDMIVTQRGFQANSKSITTTDTMMDEIISLKR